MNFRNIENALINFCQKISVPAARIALCIVYVWFGLLKVVGMSPAGQLVESLYYQTIHWIPFGTFYLFFALFECLIGILFLIPKATRIVLVLFLLHMFTTFLPLVLLPNSTWQAFFVPTLEGQYIIKNLVIIAAVIHIAASLTRQKV